MLKLPFRARRGKENPSRWKENVESRKGAVAVRHGQWLRFPSPLIKPDVRICRIRLSDWLGDRLTRGRPLGGNGAF